ncbi:C4-dicarboxylate TRAP transporter large permease protein DctM [subsurface metagenome]
MEVTPFMWGIIMFGTALVILLSGVPIWAGLAGTAILFILIMSPENMTVIPYVIYSSLDKFALLSIPLFIFMAAPIAKSRASFDLYEVIHRWLHWLPGGIGISNIFGCAIFAALCGSSPATAAAIGGVGIPEMRRRGYPASFATGLIAVGGSLGILIPPSLTMIIYGVATETSIGKLFIAGIIPGVMVTLIMAIYISCYFHFVVHRRQRREPQEPQPVSNSEEAAAPQAPREVGYTWKDRFVYLPRILPFIAIIFGVMGSLYLGWATPSEAAGVGAFLSLLFCVIIYRAYRPGMLKSIFGTAINESTMILMIMAAALFFGYALSNAYATQALAEGILGLPFGRWGIMIVINIFLLILGMFIPPAAIILLVAPILLKIILPLGFDPIWFAVIMTLNLEIGLVTPPVGLNLYIVKAIAPDIPLSSVLWGALPFMLILLLGIVLVAVFPQLALWLPGLMIGK